MPLDGFTITIGALPRTLVSFNEGQIQTFHRSDCPLYINQYKQSPTKLFTMALNCPITPQGYPCQFENQTLILGRDFVELQVKIQGVGKHQAKGKVFLTTTRLVFVSQKFATDDFKSFDIPIKLMYNQKVQMPIFGSTYLEGSVRPLQNLLPGNSHFKLWFYQGSTDTFIRCLSFLNEHYKKTGEKFTQNQQVRQFASGNFNYKAFIDPDDPSVVYVGNR